MTQPGFGVWNPARTFLRGRIQNTNFSKRWGGSDEPPPDPICAPSNPAVVWGTLQRPSAYPAKDRRPRSAGSVPLYCLQRVKASLYCCCVFSASPSKDGTSSQPLSFRVVRNCGDSRWHGASGSAKSFGRAGVAGPPRERRRSVADHLEADVGVLCEQAAICALRFVARL